MQSQSQQTAGRVTVSQRARARLLSRYAEPLLVADWDRALFIHCEVDPAALKSDVPFDLDLCGGRAYVSLVAFTLRGLRFRVGGRLGQWLLKPIATHEFLNVRTYVRHRGEAGIFFLAEWLANPLSVKLGPGTFGLPYRHGRIAYEHRHEVGELRGRVFDEANCHALSYRVVLPEAPSYRPGDEGSLDEFLLERYTAFTARHERRGFFRIWHEPWPQAPVEVAIEEDSLLRENFQWFKESRWIGGNYSPGARAVWMGRPHRIGPKSSLRTAKHSVFFELP